MNTSVERTQWRPGQLELVHLVDPLAGHSRQVDSMALCRRAEVEYLVEDVHHDLREIGGDGRDERGDLVRGDEDDAEDVGREAPEDLAAALVLHGASDRRVGHHLRAASRPTQMKMMQPPRTMSASFRFALLDR